eukprot:4438313-Lingulodinium_polyedra.AAC.1
MQRSQEIAVSEKPAVADGQAAGDSLASPPPGGAVEALKVKVPMAVGSDGRGVNLASGGPRR